MSDRFRAIFLPMIAAVLFCGICFGAAGELDRSKYIGIDEIERGMEAYCLTCYEGTKIERFELEVLSVVKGMSPGRDAILVQGLDERFIHTGPVAGCSGSPVFIDGRLAGALAFGWGFSKDALYGVTPIGEMLRVGEGGVGGAKMGCGVGIDYGGPIDFSKAYELVKNNYSEMKSVGGGLSVLPCPVSVTGLGAGACDEFEAMMGGFGFMAVPGGGEGEVSGKDVKLERGSTLAVPLVTGDISMAAVGTVTEVDGDKVYGFGHSFLGEGPIDFPMATGEIHTVVSSLMRSFKLGTSLDIVGALRYDESTAVRGMIGGEAKMVPLKVTVERYNDTEVRTYDCEVGYHKQMTPVLVANVIFGAGTMLGEIPAEHVLRYEGSVLLKGGRRISFDNVSTQMGVSEMLQEVVGALAMITNNPYEEVELESIEMGLVIDDRSAAGGIWSVSVSDTEVKRGEKIEVGVVLESFLGPKREYRCEIEVPADLKAGEYQVGVYGGSAYLQFLQKASPWRFRSENLETLLGAIEDILSVKRNSLHCVLLTGVSGVVIEGAELKDLPATKAMILQDAKRSLQVRGYQKWVEKSFETDSIVVQNKVMKIKVIE